MGYGLVSKHVNVEYLVSTFEIFKHRIDHSSFFFAERAIRPVSTTRHDAEQFCRWEQLRLQLTKLLKKSNRSWSRKLICYCRHQQMSAGAKSCHEASCHSRRAVDDHKVKVIEKSRRLEFPVQLIPNVAVIRVPLDDPFHHQPIFDLKEIFVGSIKPNILESRLHM